MAKRSVLVGRRRTEESDAPELQVACPRCRAAAGSYCKNYKGQRKSSCPDRKLEVDARSGALAARRAIEPYTAEEIRELIAEAPAQRANPHGFVRVDPRPWGKLRAFWVHPSGWVLQHCGHPTALHPWALYDGTGAMVCTGARHGDPLRGTAWWSLEEAQAWAAGEIAKAAPLRPMSAELAAACSAREQGRSADQLEAAIVGQEELPTLADAARRAHEPLAFITGRREPGNDLMPGPVPAVQLALFSST